MPKASLQTAASKAESPVIANAPASYEAAQAELEQLAAKLESGDLALEQLLASYQRGADLLRYCRDKLAIVEDQIKVLDANGQKSWMPE